MYCSIYVIFWAPMNFDKYMGHMQYVYLHVCCMSIVCRFISLFTTAYNIIVQICTKTVSVCPVRKYHKMLTRKCMMQAD